MSAHVQSDAPRILVVGSGAVGSLYGGKLAQAGATVDVLCRSDFDVVKAHGINVRSCWGDFSFQPANVLEGLSEYAEHPDFIIVTLKVLPEIKVPALISAAVRPDTTIVLLQNGIEIEDPIQTAFPDNELISGLAFVCVSRVAFGQIVHQDYGRVVIGRYPSGISPRVEQLRHLFETSNVPCTLSENIVMDRWRKLIWNAPFNPISVLGGGIDTGAIMDNPEAVSLVQDVMAEVCELAGAEGFELSREIIDRNIKDTREMKPYRTSMLLDYQGGRPMEIEAILGNAVRIAKSRGIRTPGIECLYRLMSLIAQQL